MSEERTIPFHPVLSAWFSESFGLPTDVQKQAWQAIRTSSWMVREIRNDRVYVSEAGNRFSEIPFWRNEAGARSYEIGVEIGAFLRAVDSGRIEIIFARHA